MSLELGSQRSSTVRSSPSRPDPDLDVLQRLPGRASVTAVPLSSAPSIARLREAIDNQTRPPDHVTTPAASATGPDVAAVLAAAPATGDEWLWLLDDACTPDPRALEHLLAAVELGPSIGVAGCKQRGGASGDLLLDAGLTTTRFGRLMTYVEPGDVDQGQLDHHEDVLAVRTSGLLIRRSLFEQLRGTDPGLGPTAAALDLCRRARLTGHRVVVVPSALVATTDVSQDAAGQLSRREATHLRLVQTPLLALPAVLVAVMAGALARLLVRVGVKEPGRGLTDAGQTLAAIARPDRVWRSRRLAAGTRRLRRSTLAPLLAGHRETARWHRERWYARRASLRADAASADLEPDSEPGPPLRQRLAPALLLTAALSALSVAAWHRLAGSGAVSGGALPAPGRSVDELWTSLRSSWRASGLGDDAPADPFTAVLTGASVLAGGSPRLAVVVLVVAALPLAGLGAWLAAGRGTGARLLRGWAALVWASAPALTLAAGSGRLGPLVAHVALPYAAWAVVAAVQAPILRRAWTPAAAGGLVLAVVTAGSPGIAPAALLALAAVAVCYRSRALPLVWTALPSVALLGPFVVEAATRSPRALFAVPGLPLDSTAAPAWAQLMGQPVLRTGMSLLPEPADRWLPVAATGTVVVLALLALLRRGPAGRVVRLGWAVGLLGLVSAVVSGHVVVGSDGSQVAHGWPGAGLSLALAGWVTSAVAGADGISRRLDGHAFGWRQAGTAVLAGVALAAPLATLGLWGWQTTTEPGATLLARDAEPHLPEVVVDAGTSADHARTLVLRPGRDGVRVALVRADGPGLADASALVSAAAVDGGLLATAPGAAHPADADPAQQALDRAAAVLVDGATDPRTALADLGVGHVAVMTGADDVGADSGADSGADAVLVDTLDRAVGLSRSGQAGDVVAWRVDPASGHGREAVDRAAAVRVLDPNGVPLAVVGASPQEGTADVDAQLPAATDERPRWLVLAERADDGWLATLDGRELAPVTHAGWAQAFELPPEGGHLVVRHTDRWQPAWTTGQLAVGVLTLLLAAPLPRSRAGRGSPTERGTS